MTESLLQFIETPSFRKRLDKLSDLSLLFAIQADLLEDPRSGAVIAGSGGARKGRVSDPLSNRGKSGSYRYIYLYLERVGIVYLLVLYAKAGKATLSAAETKEIAALVRALKDFYGED